MEREYVWCDQCNVRLNKSRVQRHINKVHKNKVHKKDVIKITIKNSSSKNEILHTAESEPKDEICPVCCGDGGVRGGCYKCEGTGWVSSYIKSSYRGSIALRNNDNGRISNANYIGSNKGAHYRDIDGRIGSIPNFDDYSEEGTP